VDRPPGPAVDLQRYNQEILVAEKGEITRQRVLDKPGLYRAWHPVSTTH